MYFVRSYKSIAVTYPASKKGRNGKVSFLLRLIANQIPAPVAESINPIPHTVAVSCQLRNKPITKPTIPSPKPMPPRVMTLNNIRTSPGMTEYSSSAGPRPQKQLNTAD